MHHKELLNFVVEFSKIFKKVNLYTIGINDIPTKKFDNKFYSIVNNIENVNVIRIPINKFGYEDPNNSNLYKKVCSSLITRLICSNGFFWFKNLKKILLKNIKSKSLIFISGSPFINFYLGYKFNKDLNCPYILDYRDLWTKNPRTNYFYLSRVIVNNF